MKIRPEALVEIWAKRPDVFELEPEHIRARFRAQVDAKIKELEPVPTPDPEPEQEEKPRAKRATAKKTPAKRADTEGE